MIVPLRSAVAETCGGKAGALGALLRAGLPVPDGFVVSFAAYRDLDLAGFAGQPDRLDAARRAIEARPVAAGLIDALGRALDRLGDPPVAVRSSAAHEDTGRTSAAGQHDSFLAVRGAGPVADAVRACWASLFTPRAIDYRGPSGETFDDLAMAVLVQRHLDAEVSGVMFTPADPNDATHIEASWGLGPSIVGGTVTPDAYRVAGDGPAAFDAGRVAGDGPGTFDAGRVAAGGPGTRTGTHTVSRRIAHKRTRFDRRGGRLVTSDVPAPDRDRPAIDDATAIRLAELGRKIAAIRGGPQDIEWAIADGRTWILQARPVTAAPPAWPSPAGRTPPATLTDAPDGPEITTVTLTGTPGSHGTVTGTARIIRGPRDFTRAHPGDIIICPFTDPAWTPLLRIAAGVITETGGVLSHAAIVAREHGIPAVLGVQNATSNLHDGTTITLDGTTGTITPAQA